MRRFQIVRIVCPGVGEEVALLILAELIGDLPLKLL